VNPPETKYAQSGDASIAYQVVGDGPLDLVHIPGLLSHLDLAWENPKYERFMERLSSFARVLVYDKRGCGLSDPVTEPPSVEARIDDTRAVMDAAGIKRAAVFGCSEGAALGAFFAAAHPDRVSHALLYGSFARLVPDAPDYPWSVLGNQTVEEAMDAFREGIRTGWGDGAVLILLAPSVIGTDGQAWWGRYERGAMSPRSAELLMRANVELDLREVLPVIDVPTLVMHRDRDTIPFGGGRYVADHIHGARFVELHGEDHWPWVGDPDEVCDHVEEFITGHRAPPPSERILATVMFTDIVGSTERASELGDHRWRELLDEHERLTRRELERHQGHEVKTTGDGVLATFDGPARAIRCGTSLASATDRLGLPVRVGLHTGECERRNGDIGGIAVHIGARVMAEARPGEVLVSRTVKDLTVGSDISFEERGARQLRGVPGEWELFAVTAA
jgi:class 3 adenylate cyclase/pimeloyl-ACP methyl ester carboxylesterase